MENTNMVVNEEIIESTEEIVNKASNKGLVVALGVGGVALLTLGYMKVIKPRLENKKSKKEELNRDDTEDNVEYFEGYVED